MRHLLSLLFVCWPSLLLAQEDGALSVRIELPDEGQLQLYNYFHVVLKNESELPIRIWQRETREGYFQFTFHFEDTVTGDKFTVQARNHEDPEEWDSIDREIAASEKILTLAPQKEISVRISTNGYDDIGWPTPNSGHVFRLQAKFQSEATDLNREKLIWVGKAESKPLTTTFSSPKLQTPSDYIKAGFSEKAIEMMEENPTLIWVKEEKGFLPFEAAVLWGDVRLINWLLDRDADRNLKEERYASLLVSNLNAEVIEQVLKNRMVNLDAETHYETPLASATSEFAEAKNQWQRDRWMRIAKLFIDAGAKYELDSVIRLGDLNRVKEILKESRERAIGGDEKSDTPLRVAAASGQLEICKYLIENFEIDIDDFKRGNGYPILMYALDHPEIVKLFIEHGCDLKTRITWQGFGSGVQIIGDNATLLHITAQEGVPETVKLLIDHGVDIMATTTFFKIKSGQTALHISAFYGTGDIAKVIVEHPMFQLIDKEIRQKLLDECLLMGVEHTHLDDTPDRSILIKTLLDAGANPHQKSEKGFTTLQIAAFEVHRHDDYRKEAAIRTVRLLLAQGMELDLYSLMMLENVDQVAQILQASPDLANSRDPEGTPLLHVAVYLPNSEILKLFIEAGVDTTIKNETSKYHPGETALDAARRTVEIPERYRGSDYTERLQVLELLERVAKQK